MERKVFTPEGSSFYGPIAFTGSEKREIHPMARVGSEGAIFTPAESEESVGIFCVS
jgi:hypothetical protein